MDAGSMSHRELWLLFSLSCFIPFFFSLLFFSCSPDDVSLCQVKNQVLERAPKRQNHIKKNFPSFSF